MTGWDVLVSAAMIGTERKAVPDVRIPGLAVTGPAGMNGSNGTNRTNGTGPADTGGVLLDRAALLTVARRAGRRPGRADPLPPDAAGSPPDVGVAASRRLRQILAGAYLGVLTEWLDAALARGRTVPPHLLPALLDHAVHDPGLRGRAVVAGGARARWLAALNPAWSFVLAEAAAVLAEAAAVLAEAAAPDGDQTWRLGSAAERRGYLATLRARDPDAARELVATSWSNATPDERAWFVAALGNRLGPADEDLLERALDDRRQEVRRAAAGLLMRLPGSALGQRMATRAAGCLRLTRNGRRLAAEPPADLDPSLRRDGVAPNPPPGARRAGPSTHAGQRAWWLEELLARTPLITWTDQFGRSPGEIVTMRMDEWAPQILSGWARAALAQRNPDWARALLGLALAGDLPESAPVAGLLGLLPERPRMALAAALVRSARSVPWLLSLLAGVPGPWTGDLPTAVLATILGLNRGFAGQAVPPIARQRFASPQAAEAAAQSLCRIAAVRLTPDLATLAQIVEQVCPGRLPGLSDPYYLEPEVGPHIHELAATVRFRHDMLRELDDDDHRG